MTFNSLIFWAFFAVVLLPYFTVLRRSARWQNLWLLLASYVFYGWTDWRMVPLLIAVTVLFYFLGIKIQQSNESSPRQASRLTTIGVLIGVGVLFYFKYLGFCVKQFSELLVSMGLQAHRSTLSIIMPVGISFFTFKLMSYVIEVHRGNIAPSRDFTAFATFVAFFPTILSGPIDRPGLFLPQLSSPRQCIPTRVADGLKRVLWGLFIKMCIADRWAPYTDAVLGDPSAHNTTSLLLASAIYLIQMYADFCGYSEMAIGVAQVMRLRVAENFRRPFMAQNVAEYWRWWHISLTTWITDYVFMPLNLALRNWATWGLILATIFNMVVIGAWHGANWTYVCFGLYHGILVAIVAVTDRRRKRFERQHGLKNNELYKWSNRLVTFVLVAFGAVLFRSESVTAFGHVIGAMGNGFAMPYNFGLYDTAKGVLCIALLMFREWKDEYAKPIHLMHNANVVVETASVAALIVLTMLMANFGSTSFIYFQF